MLGRSLLVVAGRQREEAGVTTTTFDLYAELQPFGHMRVVRVPGHEPWSEIEFPSSLSRKGFTKPVITSFSRAAFAHSGASEVANILRRVNVRGMVWSGDRYKTYRLWSRRERDWFRKAQATAVSVGGPVRLEAGFRDVISAIRIDRPTTDSPTPVSLVVEQHKLLWRQYSLEWILANHLKNFPTVHPFLAATALRDAYSAVAQDRLLDYQFDAARRRGLHWYPHIVYAAGQRDRALERTGTTEEILDRLKAEGRIFGHMPFGQPMLGAPNARVLPVPIDTPSWTIPRQIHRTPLLLARVSNEKQVISAKDLVRTYLPLGLTRTRHEPHPQLDLTV